MIIERKYINAPRGWVFQMLDELAAGEQAKGKRTAFKLKGVGARHVWHATDLWCIANEKLHPALVASCRAQKAAYDAKLKAIDDAQPRVRPKPWKYPSTFAMWLQSMKTEKWWQRPD